MYMSTRRPHEKKDSLTVPLDISQRKLPPLPISKRKLPELPQSKSATIRSNIKCREKETKIDNPNIVITPPQSLKHLQKHPSNRSLRNLFANIQRKVVGSKQTIKDNTQSQTIITPSKWRPLLQFIINDEELLYNLITFMEKQYNEENILFLQSVNTLKSHINHILMFESQINIVKEEKINYEIVSIYNKYITKDAEKQINVSSDCFYDIMSKHQSFKQLSLTQRASIFDRSYKEIDHLIKRSILSGFYQDDLFQSVAHKRNILDNDTVKYLEVSDSEYDSDDVEYEIAPKYKGNTPTNAAVHFDCHSVSKWTNNNKYMISSKGYAPESGIHEWKIKILKTTKKRQEFGIVSICNGDIKMNEFGICDTPNLGARAVYGYNNMHPTFYYASYNKDNAVRCDKDLSSLSIHQQKQWNTGDVVKIRLNMSKYSMKFYLNGQQVRKTLSVEKDTTFYPIILYSGDCEYQLV